MRDIRQYDEDDRNTAVVQRAPASNLGWTPSLTHQTGDTIRADFIKSRDLLGRVTFVSIYDDDIHMSYNGSGPLSAYKRIHFATNRAPDDEQYHVDALGNIAATLVDGGNTRDTNSYDPLSGRIRWISPPALTGTTMAFDYDQAGNQKFIQRARLAPALTGQQMLLFTNTQFAYDASGKLRKSSMRPDVSKNGSLAPADEDAYNEEETRYDALGRRVWVRSYHAEPQFAAASASFASVTRFVWDGDQVLGEFRMPVTQQENDLTPIFTWMPIPDSLGILHRGDGSDSVQTYSWMWGRSIYVHGVGIDQPIAIFRAESGDSATLFDPFVMYPLTDWRGNMSSVSFADGAPLRFGNQRATPPLPTEQNSELTAYRQRGAKTWTVSSWVGSLIGGQFGASGLEYRRNRYYDPQQGRFTQEDPIGLAGGMNLYGFAGGDPVNFSDPFGLYIEPIQDARVRAVLAKMLESPTFKKIWLAMALAPKDQATYRFDVTDFDGVSKFSAGQSGAGHTLCGMHACTTKINGDNIGVSVVTDEFVHAAAGADLGVAKKAGVPAACAYHGPGYSAAGCGDIRSKIESETDAAQKKKPKENP